MADPKRWEQRWDQIDYWVCHEGEPSEEELNTADIGDYLNNLEAEVVRLRAALEEIAAHVEEKLGGGLVLSMTSAEITRWYEGWTAATPASIARAALEGAPPVAEKERNTA